MKPIYIFAFVVVIGIFGLVSCKPKETTVSGQLFIVTKGAENIKLGGVEILLIKKSQATQFLKASQKNIEAILSDAKNDSEQINNYFFKKGKLPSILATNKNYVAADLKFNNAMSLSKSYLQLQKMAGSNLSKVEDAGSKVEEALSDAKKALEDIQSVSKDVLNDLANHPTATDYFCEFAPSSTAKTLSDADGKFSVTYPAGIQFSIYAKAQRFTPNKTEVYYWLVDAPTNDNQKFLLYNSNLATVDPDSYFKIKPKEN